MFVAPREDRTALGVGLMALAVLGFTCIDTSAKWLITMAGLPALQVVFARYAGHFLLALAMFAPSEGLDVFRSNAPWRQVLRSVMLFGSTILNFLALQALPLTLTTTIMFAGPIVVTLLAIPVLGEKVGLSRIIAVILGFGGVMVAVQPWGAEFNPAVFYSLGALLSAASYFLMTRLLAGVESNATSQIWSSGIATICLLPVAVPIWAWPADWPGVVVLAMIGVFGGLSHVVATTAHRLADASILAPVIYIQIALAAIASILVFNVWPTVWTFGGGLIIIACGLYIWRRERAKKSGIDAEHARWWRRVMR